MRVSSTILVAAAGLALGAGLVALLPQGALFAVAAQHDHAAGAPGERWACPMMDFIGTKPGDCPVCGMKMTKVTAGELTREQQRRMGVELTAVSEGPAVVTARAYGTADYDHRYTTVVLPRVAGGKLFSDALTRVVFVQFVLYFRSVVFHVLLHQ